MVITLTPEIEQALNELAKKQGTTIEILAVKTLQERLFLSKPKPLVRKSRTRHPQSTLADFLDGYVGVFDSSELVKGGAQMSKNTSKKFGEILLEKRRQGKL
jgi:hypothetical protein